MHVVVTSIGGRPYMEDTHIVIEKLINNIDLYCVFDGHGGAFVAEYLRDHYADTLKEIIRNNAHSIPDMLFHSIQNIVANIPKDKSFHCGSTFLIALKYGEVLFIANGGDCRAIMNSDINVQPITTDHKPSLQREYERIIGGGGFVTFNPMDAPRVNGNLAVSRSVGDFYLYPHVTWVPDIYIVKLDSKNNLLVMASDGLWDTMSNEEVNNIFISNIVKNNNTITYNILHDSANECMEMARTKGSTDNITILVTTL